MKYIYNAFLPFIIFNPFIRETDESKKLKKIFYTPFSRSSARPLKFFLKVKLFIFLARIMSSKMCLIISLEIFINDLAILENEKRKEISVIPKNINKFFYRVFLLKACQA